MKYILITLLILSGSAYAVENSEMPLWLKNDIEISQKFKRVTTNPVNTTKGFYLSLRGFHQLEIRKVGFGVKRYLFNIIGGYGTPFISIISHEGEWASIQISYVLSEKDWDMIYQKAKEHGLKLEEWGDHILYNHGKYPQKAITKVLINEKKVDQIRKLLEEKLGKPEFYPPDIKKSPDDDFYLLGSWHSYLRFGYDAGWGPSTSYTAIQRLMRENKTDIIHSILKGLNPEGRIFAADILIKRGNLTKDERMTIKAIRSMDLDILTIHGDNIKESDKAKASEILPEI